MAHHRSMGYRFHPTSREVMKYLLGFAIEEPLPEQDELMQLVDLYGDKEPWQILEGNTRYFITQLKKEKAHFKRFKRSVGEEGTWKTQDPAKQVFDNKGRLMGYVHHLKYTPPPKKSSMIKNLFGEWLMTEYSLYDGYVTDIKRKIKNKNFVICKIKKKKKEKSEKHENMMMSEVEVDEFMNSVLEEEEDIDHKYDGQEKNIMEGEDDVGDDFLALLERDDNVMKNGISKNVEEDHLLAHEINSINLDEYQFV